MSDWNDETAEWYAEKYGEYPTNRLGLAGIALHDGMTVVDIGCGAGAALRHVAQQISGTFIGVDPVPRMLEIARERAGDAGIDFRIGHASAIPVEDERADLILAFDSFDHWADKRRGLDEILRALTADGTAVFVKDRAAPGGSASVEELRSLATAAGFIVSDTEHVEAEDVRFFRVLLTRA